MIDYNYTTVTDTAPLDFGSDLHLRNKWFTPESLALSFTPSPMEIAGVGAKAISLPALSDKKISALITRTLDSSSLAQPIRARLTCATTVLALGTGIILELFPAFLAGESNFSYKVRGMAFSTNLVIKNGWQIRHNERTHCRHIFTWYTDIRIPTSSHLTMKQKNEVEPIG